MSGELGGYPIIGLDLTSLLPPYEQIRTQIVTGIAAKRLVAGAPLPSVRQLARDLDIAPNTVVRAYETLAQDGWIIAVPRVGFVVATVPIAVTNEERQRRLRSAVANLIAVAQQLQLDITTVHAEIDRQMRPPLPDKP